MRYEIRNPGTELFLTVVDGAVVDFGGIDDDLVTRVSELAATPINLQLGPEVPAVRSGLDDPAVGALTVQHVVRLSPPSGLPVSGWVAYGGNGIIAEPLDTSYVVYPEPTEEDLAQEELAMVTDVDLDPQGAATV